ncbi:ATP-dependent DNA helicase recQ [Blyttiomyces helicus]|uniref:DNA 3'-5' helicase n=1 Tax=Blyttiomyces helicus TaxID=388810 RepID=A0A4V1ISE3_9FUNG|nr:ATP-dependent DNA helicase recQ [Blyttiomyces helicus]|eukprot:RKO93257.1 ATP-dependent DNA helicase recQ [Blyttiomyces helicus]
MTTDIFRARSVLKEVFGFDDFKPGQAQVVERLLDGKSTVAIFPTGAGKSLCYQLPALCDEPEADGKYSLTLIVSPLIALMKDQVDGLKRRNVAAASLDSSLDKNEDMAVKRAIQDGRLRMLYVAPERFNNEAFVAMLLRQRVSLFAVDEAHCISEWGHAFRPDYLKLARFAKECKAERVLCLTATATPQVATDICKAFDIPDEGLIRTGSFRPNLCIKVLAAPTSADRDSQLIQVLKAGSGAGIVYVTVQKSAEEVAAKLKKAGFKSEAYHAGMASDVRKRVQDRFMSEPDMIIASTIAFGMGVDKADIRRVIHYNLPKSLEGYSQEIGRAGRDGLQSNCTLFLCPDDRQILEGFIYGDTPSAVSIRSLLGEMLQPGAHKDDIIISNAFEQQKTHDIRPTTLATLLAQLDLSFGLMRALTPFYASYELEPRGGFRPALQTGSVQQAIARASTVKVRWTSVDVERAATIAQVDRAQVVSVLQNWESSGNVSLKPSGVRNRYRLLRDGPSETELDTIAADMTRRVEKRETDEIARLQSVINWASSRATCLARSLADHFGDAATIPAKGCGCCSWCVGGHKGVAMPAASAKPGTGSKRAHGDSAVDAKRVAAVLAVIPARDDPRLLARFAFGISSPRITALRLGRHPAFGSMEDHGFPVLLERFQEECRAKRGRNV